MRYFFQLTFILTLALFSSCGKKTEETKPIRKDVVETVFASGALEPEGKYNLTAQTDGYIVDLKFDDGDTVQKDQVLAVIDNRSNEINSASAGALLSIASRNASPEGPTLKQAEQNLQYLKEKFAQDSIQYGRFQKLFQSNSVSKLELENAKLAFDNSRTSYRNAEQNYKLARQQTEQQLLTQKSLSEVSSVMTGYNQTRAVVGGRVYKRLKQNGDFVRRGDILAIIGSTNDLFAKLSVDETNINKVKAGQQVIVELNTDKDKIFKAALTEVYPSFDEQTQSFYCKAVFTDKLDFKVSGTQLQANIVIAEKRNALVIPKNFLGFGDKVKIKGKGEVTVKTGFVSSEWVEILDGLNESDEIVTENIK
jgi:multidrug efflux pump subunit AcrA (membrane-fusion protein)